METKAQEITRRRFTVHDYHRMAEAGILHEDDRVELIEGDIVEMAAIGSRHFTCVNELNRLLVRGVGDEAIVSVQTSSTTCTFPKTATVALSRRGGGDAPVEGFARARRSGRRRARLVLLQLPVVKVAQGILMSEAYSFW